jgi:hypothetical protein
MMVLPRQAWDKPDLEIKREREKKEKKKKKKKKKKERKEAAVVSYRDRGISRHFVHHLRGGRSDTDVATDPLRLRSAKAEVTAV